MNTALSLAPRSLDEAMRFADLLSKSEMVPKDYRGKPADILVAVQWGGEVGLAPLQALQNISAINGRPAIWGDAALALVRGSSVCDDVIETLEGEGEAMVATCDARRIGKAPVVRRFSVAQAKKAGLWSKAGPWTQYPERMLQQRARGFALRDAFPDILRGVITVEEARDIPREPIDVTPPREPLEPLPKKVRDMLDPLTAVADLEAEGKPEAEKGGVALDAWILTLSKSDKAALKGEPGRRLRALADEADERASMQQPEIPIAGERLAGA